MCFPMISLIVEIIPYLCVVTLPIYGCFCGIELILRMSVILYLYILISELLPVGMVVPYANILLFGLIWYYFPVFLFPWWIIWIYDKVLWISEVGLQIAEIILVLNFVMHCSQRVIEKIEEENSLSIKILSGCFSSICISLTASLALSLYKSSSGVQLLVLCLTLALVLAVYNMMWLSHEGILIDAAFAGLCSLAALYAMNMETTLILHPLSIPDTWYMYDKKHGLFTVAMDIVDTTVDNANRAVAFLYNFIQPFFLIMLGVRLYSILYIIERLRISFQGNDKESYISSLEYSEYEEQLSPWKSTMITKLAIVFMITQKTSNLLYESRGVSLARFYPLQFLENFYPRDIIWGRVLQVVVVNLFYMWRLYYSDEWEWHDWFSEL